MATRWVVLKFGGTSVSTPERWRIIADLAARRIAERLRPLIVCSALSGVSNQLEALLGLAVEGRHEEALEALRRRHLELGAELRIDAPERLADDFEELSRLALAASLLREAGPALKARVMAFGELMSTRLGAAFLETQGIATSWLDARTALEAREDSGARAYLSATCDFERDEALSEELAALPGAAVITQGFIARNRERQTVLLGRGGSDTSASYLAARLGAERCEIWTDVPGLFTANPSLLPSARLLRALNYEEAQEIATTGAKVLHPRSIPPLRKHRIPLHVLSTDRPDIPGTVISASGPVTGPQVKAISSRSGITLISMETVGMWQEVGFLAKAFEIFAQHGVSIDSVSTSETNVTVSLDPGANALEPPALRALLADLSAFCEPQVIAPTASLSLVGRGIRAILHELGPVLEAFEELKIHLVTQAASDLNLTFIVDEEHSERLVRQLHGLLFGHQVEGPIFGPSWTELFGREGEAPGGVSTEWWRGRRQELLELAAERGPVYVYDAGTLRASAEALRSLTAIDRLFYALKANANPEVLRAFHEAALSFECVSAAEIDHVLALFPDLEGARLLFTPNFAPREEYVRGFAAGARVTLDNVHPLREWPEVFAGRKVFLRLDPGRGRGHHAHVRTAGAQSKFGIAPDQLEEMRLLLAANKTRVVGLHAHMGSGIRTPEAWQEVALFLAAEAGRFPDVKVLDLGGGLGVPERPGQSALDLASLDDLLRRFKAVHPRFELWLEPGRFLVALAGVLLARVTQVKHKGEVRYVGLETGMNSLIRPPLYGAYHPIYNLTRLDETPAMVAHVVGPICETGDILGQSRRLPPTFEGDVMLIANAGAYGRVMSSHYNLREPASETLLSSPS
ncbi:MAG TPA: bifunctional aspartate kinase/diaminopimelate decarboxylase [Thermoanaerobaculia bacterium]|nr:bifunctional aspartate kinase/diaminopimelate decarboxylase [Thermoanaerobaculia bacterium]